MPAVAEKIEERSRSSVLAIPTSTSLATSLPLVLQRFAGGVEVAAQNPAQHLGDRPVRQVGGVEQGCEEGGGALGPVLLVAGAVRSRGDRGHRPVPSAAPRPRCWRRGSATSTADGPPGQVGALAGGIEQPYLPELCAGAPGGVHHVGLGRSRERRAGRGEQRGDHDGAGLPGAGWPENHDGVLGVGVTQPPPGVNPRNAPPPRRTHVLPHRIRRARRRLNPLRQRRRKTLRAHEAGQQAVRDEREPGEQQEVPDERRQQRGEQEDDERFRANFEPTTVLAGGRNVLVGRTPTQIRSCA